MTEWTLHTCPKLEERYYELFHESGLRVLLSPKELSAVYATIGIGYGSRDRFSGGALPMGIAHFLEHKMFERPGGETWEDVFSALGAEVNAYTSDDHTAYMFSATDHVPEALTALIRMVTELSVTAASVSRERAIIAEEIRMNADDPWEVCYANMLKGLYAPVKKGGNLVREEICGTEASIRRITPTALAKAHGRFYHPDNMVLAISGRITPEEVLAAVDTAFEAQKLRKPAGKAALAKRSFRDPSCVYKSRISETMDTAKPLFSIGIKISEPPTDPMESVRLERRMTVLSEMLFSRSGDFYDHLFENCLISPGMAYGSSLGRPSLGSASADGYGYFYLSGECDDPEAVYAAFSKHMAELHRRGLDISAFERAKRTLYADFVYGFDSTEGIASSLMTTAMDGVGLYELMELDSKMTFEDVTRLFEQVFLPTQYTLSTVVPSKKESE